MSGGEELRYATERKLGLSSVHSSEDVSHGNEKCKQERKCLQHLGLQILSNEQSCACLGTVSDFGRRRTIIVLFL